MNDQIVVGRATRHLNDIFAKRRANMPTLRRHRRARTRGKRLPLTILRLWPWYVRFGPPYPQDRRGRALSPAVGDAVAVSVWRLLVMAVLRWRGPGRAPFPRRCGRSASPQ